MPAGNITLFDLITLQRNDILTGLVEDVTTYAPEFAVIPIVTRPGHYYEIVKRTALPTAAFRVVNNGTSAQKSAYKKEVKEMFFIDTPINMDEAALKADDKSSGDIWAHESQGVLQATLITLGAQTWYGTAADSNGFQGVRAQLAGSIGAGGSTNSTSAYLLWLNQWGCRFDVGENGQIAMPPPMRQQIAAASPGTGTLFAWVSNLSCWVGFSVMSNFSTWAVTGITTHQTTGKYDQALTDIIAAQLVSNIPLVRRQGLTWFLNRTTYFLLQQSRTSINQQVAGSQGQPAWSPPPNMLEGYNIVVTDSILNSESN